MGVLIPLDHFRYSTLREQVRVERVFGVIGGSVHSYVLVADTISFIY
jgi:hypothetical protein